MPLATLVRNPNLRVPNLVMDLNHMTMKNAADFVLLPWTPRLPFATKIPKAILPALCLFASAASVPDTNLVIAQKTRHQWAFRRTRVTSTANSLSVPIHPSFSASPSSLTLPSANARPTIPLNTPVHGAGPPIMEPAHKSVFEVSTTPQSFLETPLASAPLYRDW